MSYKSGFFNATESGGVYDRVYDASDFAHYFSLFVGNGVFAKSSSNLQVLANGSGMTVSIQPGNGWINGYYLTLESGTTESLTIPTANATLNRIDSVIMGLDFTQRKISLYIRSGSVSAQPVAVSLQRNTEKYELELAQITVAAGASVITQSVVKDTREDSTRCGIVKGLIDEIDTTALFAQYDQKFVEFYSTSKTAFDTWFANLQYVLDGDVAGHLQNEINTKLNRSGDTLTGDLLQPTIPVQGTALIPKNYADNLCPYIFDETPVIVRNNIQLSSFTLEDNYKYSLGLFSGNSPFGDSDAVLLEISITATIKQTSSFDSAFSLYFDGEDSKTAAILDKAQSKNENSTTISVSEKLLYYRKGLTISNSKLYPTFTNGSTLQTLILFNYSGTISDLNLSIKLKKGKIRGLNS